ncbi:mycofactocin system FadH/OYE family oxidoreductase 1 [Streptomyces sp. NBC_00582]|uniref:mycofactocin system FadH/OYE family oxidoreductase 1 n=1 Tax=Streptomyces sp. NBC_00582 TaxID=2975783 RepID=UPI0010F2CB49|nr:mycofactocin system FadH/OYE family oxidoreductase 1 [Streptomyces sp. NBC_00582]WUB59223.1 mycofactocin system FadH/OYE family oxidoreductase 1 [Streptomyces sp. NBC_00582]
MSAAPPGHGALTTPLRLAGRTLPGRIVFGPHATNLCADRRFTDRSVAYYARRAAGGCGLVVTEEASVLPGDRPYERAPLAERCGPGWAAVADAVHGEGAVCVAALGHSGSQGSSGWGTDALWAPSPVPQVGTHEMPYAMEPADVADLVDAFRRAAVVAVDAGCDGVELNAGQHSLLRQFLSGLTNHRDDAYGRDRALLLCEVVAAVRRVLPGRILGLRLCADELAPWAGITPADGIDLAVRLADEADYLVVVRGSALSESATRPAMHEPPGFNRELCRAVRAAVAGRVPVVLQGSVVEPAMAAHALEHGVCDAVEMTRALLADPDLPRKAAQGLPPRPCVLCNQRCQVRDHRGVPVSCAVEPGTGREGTGGGWPSPPPRDITVVGGGPAGLEAARVAALRGHRVVVRERLSRTGGALRVAARAPGRERWGVFADWLETECRRLGVRVETGRAGPAGNSSGSAQRVLAVGGGPGPAPITPAEGLCVLSPRDIHTAQALPAGEAVVWDPLGGAVAIAVALALAARPDAPQVVFLTPDGVVGQALGVTGELVAATEQLHAAGVRVVTYIRPVAADPGTLRCEDVHTGEQLSLPCAVFVDCGPELPRPCAGTGVVVGDAVAPRTVYQAVLDARRAVLGLEAGHP